MTANQYLLSQAVTDYLLDSKGADSAALIAGISNAIESILPELIDSGLNSDAIVMWMAFKRLESLSQAAMQDLGKEIRKTSEPGSYPRMLAGRRLTLRVARPSKTWKCDAPIEELDPKFTKLTLNTTAINDALKNKETLPSALKSTDSLSSLTLA